MRAGQVIETAVIFILGMGVMLGIILLGQPGIFERQVPSPACEQLTQWAYDKLDGEGNEVIDSHCAVTFTGCTAEYCREFVARDHDGSIEFRPIGEPIPLGEG